MATEPPCFLGLAGFRYFVGFPKITGYSSYICFLFPVYFAFVLSARLYLI